MTNIAIKDIQADEAERDWGDASALDVRQRMDAVTRDRGELSDAQDELSQLEGLGDLTTEEQQEHAYWGERERSLRFVISFQCATIG